LIFIKYTKKNKIKNKKKMLLGEKKHCKKLKIDSGKIYLAAKNQCQQ